MSTPHNSTTVYPSDIEELPRVFKYYVGIFQKYHADPSQSLQL